MGAPVLLVANPGEIALRVIRAARALGLGTVLVHSEADADLPHARAAARAAGVPVLPGTVRLPDDPGLWPALARGVGFPLLVKAVAGGGGHGMRVVEGALALAEAITQVRQIAACAFGDGGAYLDRFLPSPGLLTRLSLPQGQGLRIDFGHAQGNPLTPFYDPLVLKLIAHGADRAQAMARLVVALDGLRIEGIRTNAAFVRALLLDPRVLTLQHDTRMLDRG